MSRELVFTIEGGLEVDRRDIANVERRRIYYDDVVMVARYKRSAPLMIVLGLFSALPPVLILWLATDPVIRAIGFAWFCVSAVLTIAVAILKFDDVLVRSTRTDARLSFLFRKQKHRETFQQILGEVRRAQIRKRKELGLPNEQPEGRAESESLTSTPAQGPPEPTVS